MADLPVVQGYEVEAPDSVLKKLLEVKIQEFKSRAARHKQDIEDLQKGRIKDLEAKITMLELSIVELEAKRDSIIVNKE
jgi:AAA+ ATPase superfamily predicted ATPase